MKSANEIPSEIHNEIQLILVKSVEFNDILNWHEKHLKSEKHNCSWKAQVLFMKSATVHEKRRCFSWKAQLFMKSTGAFHEKRCFSKDHLQGIVTMFSIIGLLFIWSTYIDGTPKPQVGSNQPKSPPSSSFCPSGLACLPYDDWVCRYPFPFYRKGYNINVPLASALFPFTTGLYVNVLMYWALPVPRSSLPLPQGCI